VFEEFGHSFLKKGHSGILRQKDVSSKGSTWRAKSSFPRQPPLVMLQVPYPPRTVAFLQRAALDIQP